MKANTTSILPDENIKHSRKIGLFSSMAKDIVVKRLQLLKEGSLILKDGEDTYYFGNSSDQFKVSATINVNDDNFYAMLAFGGSVGAGESYIVGEWSSDNLTNVIRIMVRNMELLDGIENGLASMVSPFRKVLHWLNSNTLDGSKKNIAAHYDLGNDFFELFLAPSMMYSCGIFEDEYASMEQASIAKLKRICDKLQLNQNDHVIEIGTGWGGFAIFAAKNYGCKVTTTTISRNQYEWAQRRVLEENLEDKITLLFE